MSDKPYDELYIRILMDRLTEHVVNQSLLAHTAIQNDDIPMSLEIMAENVNLILNTWREIALELTPHPTREQLIAFFDEESTRARVQLMQLHNSMAIDASKLLFELPESNNKEITDD